MPTPPEKRLNDLISVLAICQNWLKNISKINIEKNAIFCIPADKKAGQRVKVDYHKGLVV